VPRCCQVIIRVFLNILPLKHNRCCLLHHGWLLNAKNKGFHVMNKQVSRKLKVYVGPLERIWVISWRYYLFSFIYGCGIHKLLKFGKNCYNSFRKYCHFVFWNQFQVFLILELECSESPNMKPKMDNPLICTQTKSAQSFRRYLGAHAYVHRHTYIHRIVQTACS
jgi:hypothetical protein